MQGLWIKSTSSKCDTRLVHWSSLYYGVYIFNPAWRNDAVCEGRKYRALGLMVRPTIPRTLHSNLRWHPYFFLFNIQVVFVYCEKFDRFHRKNLKKTAFTKATYWNTKRRIHLGSLFHDLNPFFTEMVLEHYFIVAYYISEVWANWE